MKSAHAIAWPSPADIPGRRPSRLKLRLRTCLCAPWLDRELAAGVASWRSELHAARALQLTSDRNRRGLARSLERLVADTESPPAPFRGAAVPPCREQVLDALPVIRLVAARLRSGDPVHATGIARLSALLSEGAGPCYMRIKPDALTNALLDIAQWLAVPE